MSLRRRDLAALVVVSLTLLLGTAAWMAGPTATGAHLGLRIQDGQVVVESVDSGSPAGLSGLQPGKIVVQLDDLDLLAASADVRASVVAHPRRWQSMGTLWPDELPAELAARERLAKEQAAAASATPVPGTDGGPPIDYNLFFPATIGFDFYWPDGSRANAFPAIALGVLVLLGGIWWLGTGMAGASLRRLAITLPVATAVPLVVLPLQLLAAQPAQVASILLVPAGMAPLAADFLDRLENPVTARGLRLVAAALGIGSVVTGVAFLTGLEFGACVTYSAILAAAIAVVPGFLAARPTFWLADVNSSGSAPAPGRFVESTELVLAAATPGVALIALVWKGWTPFLVPIVVWLAAILLARRFTLRPLLRLATRATLQRDVVVAATEAERARIAADIHDDALQDLTMLVRRLDAAGDVENAEAAREIAARLRTICGELRLPILDDLGLGPALDWLTERFESIAGGPVYLERLRDEQRPPANVELAIFRVAQEALANAAKHGAPPIVVRYRAGGHWAELDVDDAGPGLAPGAAELAEQAGHLGLLNMAQRAETVGADLRIGRRPGGGTRVTLVWEADAPSATTASATTAAVPSAAS